MHTLPIRYQSAALQFFNLFFRQSKMFAQKIIQDAYMHRVIPMHGNNSHFPSGTMKNVMASAHTHKFPSLALKQFQHLLSREPRQLRQGIPVEQRAIVSVEQFLPSFSPARLLLDREPVLVSNLPLPPEVSIRSRMLRCREATRPIARFFRRTSVPLKPYYPCNYDSTGMGGLSSHLWMFFWRIYVAVGTNCFLRIFRRSHSSRTSRSSASHALRVGALAQTPWIPRTLPKNPFPLPNRSYRALLAIIWSTYRVNISSVYNNG